MTAVFSKKEIANAFKSRRTMLIVWFCFLALYIGAVATMVTINAVEIATERTRESYLPFMIITIVLTIIFASGTLFFFGIKFKLTNKFCNMLSDIEFGLKDRTSGKFIGIDPSIREKDGVYFYSLVLSCAPQKRGDINERKVLIEKDHSLPRFRVGEEIKIITYANILLAYERISSGAVVNDNDEDKE
ncbi:MAG: hypothetical protein IKC64_03700 [Clostridia bacterium]|nr:hypothetical protein [Clostridia bacterium]